MPTKPSKILNAESYNKSSSTILRKTTKSTPENILKDIPMAELKPKDLSDTNSLNNTTKSQMGSNKSNLSIDVGNPSSKSPMSSFKNDTKDHKFEIKSSTHTLNTSKELDFDMTLCDNPIEIIEKVASSIGTEHTNLMESNISQDFNKSIHSKSNSNDVKKE